MQGTLPAGHLYAHRDEGDVALAREGRSFLLLHGYVSGGPGLDLGVSASRNAEQLLSVLNRFNEPGALDQFVRGLAGSFSILCLREDGEIMSITDRWASRPIWCSQSAGRVVISSHVLAIVRRVKQSDTDHISTASVLLYGAQIVPGPSLFTGVAAQQPGSLKFYGDSESKSRKWYQFCHRPDFSRSTKAWSKLVARRMTESADRILKVSENPRLFLSGGLDSRLAAAALVSAGCRPLMLSLADHENLEIRVARAVAKIFGCEHIVTLRDQEHYLRALRATPHSSDGNFSWIHSHFSEVLLKLRANRGPGHAILGDLSEAFSKLLSLTPASTSEFWSPEEFTENFDSALLPNYAPRNAPRSLLLLNAEVREDARSGLRRRLSDYYSEVRETSPQPAIVFDQILRWRSLGSQPTFQMFLDVRSVSAERNVMLDPGVHELLEELPAEERADRRLGAKILAELHPLSALVPDANSLIPVMGHGALHRFSKWMRPQLGKVKRRLLSNDHTTTASWPHLPLLMQKNEVWKSEIKETLLESSSLDSAVWDKRAVEASLQDFFNGDIDRHTDVEHLLSIAGAMKSLS